jgi:hypothetical protein
MHTDNIMREAGFEFIACLSNNEGTIEGDVVGKDLR